MCFPFESGDGDHGGDAVPTAEARSLPIATTPRSRLPLPARGDAPTRMYGWRRTWKMTANPFLKITLLLFAAMCSCVVTLHSQEVAAVQINGEPVFSVSALAGDSVASAPVRADRISGRIASLLDSDQPLTPVRVVQVDDYSAVLVGNDTIVEVRQLDAEVATAEPLPAGQELAATQRVARDWASALTEALARASAQERARVVVQGLPLFDVTGTREIRAGTRAASIGIQISEIAGTPGNIPEVRVALRDGKV